MSPHAAANHAVEVALDPLIVNRDDIAQSTRCILGHGGFLLLTWLRLATSSSARFGGRQPYPIVRNIPYVIDLSELSASQQDELWTQVDNWAVAVVLANFCQRPTRRARRPLGLCRTPRGHQGSQARTPRRTHGMDRLRLRSRRRRRRRALRGSCRPRQSLVSEAHQQTHATPLTRGLHRMLTCAEKLVQAATP